MLTGVSCSEDNVLTLVHNISRSFTTDLGMEILQEEKGKQNGNHDWKKGVGKNRGGGEVAKRACKAKIT